MLRFLRLFLPVILACAAAAAFASRAAGADDWLPIAPEDLTLKDNPANPGSDAMILYREHSVDQTKGSVEEYQRIKIFSESGEKYGDVEIFYNQTAAEIRDIRARTIRPDGGITVFQGQVFDKIIVKAGGLKLNAKAFTLPDVLPGAIIEYKYRVAAKPHHTVDSTWMVQVALYTRDARFTMRPAIPGAMGWRAYGHALPIKPEKLPDGSYLLQVHALPGVADEEYMPPEGVLRLHVNFFYRLPFDPTGKTTPEYWAFWCKNLSHVADEFLSKKKLLDAEVARLIAPGDAPEQKLRKLYARAMQVHNTSFDPGKTEKELKREKENENQNVDDLLKHGAGTSLEINMLFVGLARAEGFDATVAMVVTRDRNTFRPDFQDYRELSTDLVSLKLPSGDVYVDPGARFYPYGLLPWQETDAKGIRGNSSSVDFITTPAPQNSDAILRRRTEMNIDAEGNLSGTLEVEFAGQFGALHRVAEREEDELGRKKDISDEIKSWLPETANLEITKIGGWDDINAPVHVEASLRLPGFSSAAGRRLLTPFTPFRIPEAKAFAPSKRVNDIYFDCQWVDEDDILIRAPENFQVAPPAGIEPIESSLASYGVVATPEGTALRIRRKLAMVRYRYAASLYNSLHDFFEAVRVNDQTQLLVEPKPN
ncbi:MAG TPA: DUF3857 domain-containing protein [Candidatus Acidoferrales bacterium]|nr:DUF3857 domain-containing protein [Candidatus Acidoferrales bacterium]